MKNTLKMQERDAIMFNGITRKRIYRGKDKTLLTKGEITAVQPVDHGAKPLIGKFSAFNLSFLLPEQRKLFLEQMKFELTLTGEELNQYLSQRYTDEDMYEIWLMQQKASPKRKRKVGYTAKNKAKKRAVSLKQQRRQLTPEQQAEKVRKLRATLARNKADPNYVSYANLQKLFKTRQKLLAQRAEAKLKTSVAIFANDTINRKVYSKTRTLQLENTRLREFIKQNGMHLPGSRKEKNRRESLRLNKND